MDIRSQKNSLDQDVIDKGHEKHVLDKDEIENIHENNWFKIKSINQIEAYILETGKYKDDTVDYYLPECILYESKTK